MANELQIGSLIGMLVLFLILVAFAIYGLIQLFIRKKFEVAYVDKYKQILDVSKMGCPYEIYEKQLIKSPDKHFSGVSLGYIYGKNFISMNGKFYHLFVISDKLRRFYNPFSWGSPDKIAVASQEKVSLGNNFNIKWTVGGLDYEGFYIFEAGGDLTPNDIFAKTKTQTGLKEANIMLKQLSELVDRGVEANPDVNAKQKVSNEVFTKER